MDQISLQLKTNKYQPKLSASSNLGEDSEPELRAIERLDYVLGALSIQVSKNSAAKQLSYRARHKVARMAGWQAAMMAALPEQLLTSDLSKDDIQRHQWEDSWCKSLVQYLAAGILPEDEALRDRMRFVAENYVVRDAILYHLWWTDAKGRLEPREQVVIPATLQDDVIRHYCHNDHTLANW